MLECARLEEFDGRPAAALALLDAGDPDAKHDWKLRLEAVQLLQRSGDWPGALASARAALARHPAVGRLWAVYAQLVRSVAATGSGPLAEEDRAAVSHAAVVAALRAVPRSGEVWCEAARLWLDPTLPAVFSPRLARRCLALAMHFTPQYGDSFLERLRLERIGALLLAALGGGGGGGDADYSLASGGPSAALAAAAHAAVVADPNYGVAWTFCRRGATDSAYDVVARADALVAAEVAASPAAAAAYTSAAAAVGSSVVAESADLAWLLDKVPAALLSPADAACLLAPPPPPPPPAAAAAGAGAAVADPVDFVTGLAACTRQLAASLATLPAAARRAAIFGFDPPAALAA